MNDTHGVNGVGWYGFDLDGTLAKYEGWKGISHIGEPIAPMIYTIKELHRCGYKVKILTARVAPRDCIWNNRMFGTTKFKFSTKFPFIKSVDEHKVCEQFEWVWTGGNGFDPEDYSRKYAREYIAEWCEKNLGFIPEIVHEKDHLMLQLFDDRVVQVEPNTGRILGRFPDDIGWANPAVCPCCG